jgi:hypothetical protein
MAFRFASALVGCTVLHAANGAIVGYDSNGGALVASKATPGGKGSQMMSDYGFENVEGYEDTNDHMPIDFPVGPLPRTFEHYFVVLPTHSLARILFIC